MIYLKKLKLVLSMGVVVLRWLLFSGGRQVRFDCLHILLLAFTVNSYKMLKNSYSALPASTALKSAQAGLVLAIS
jgi:hypothetical protein